MKVSAKTEYACIAMLELAAAYDVDVPVRIRHIAQQHQIPSRFLVQILLQLKGAGLVASTRGAAGGYQLVKPPADVTLGDIMTVMEGPADQGLASSAGPDSIAARVLMDVWRDVARHEQAMLSDVTLAELVEQARKQTENMYYI